MFPLGAPTRRVYSPALNWWSTRGNERTALSALPLDLDYLPRWPRRKDFRIGIAGSGFIVRDCHLVAYRQAGFNPIAMASRDPARARAVAAQHGVARVHATYAELLADP